MEKTTLKELINLLEQELIRIGYKESTLHYYRKNWKRLIAYFDERGEQFFSEKTAMQYVDDKCDFFAKSLFSIFRSTVFTRLSALYLGNFS